MERECMTSDATGNRLIKMGPSAIETLLGPERPKFWVHGYVTGWAKLDPDGGDRDWPLLDQVQGTGRVQVVTQRRCGFAAAPVTAGRRANPPPGKEAR